MATGMRQLPVTDDSFANLAALVERMFDDSDRKKQVNDITEKWTGKTKTEPR